MYVLIGLYTKYTSSSEGCRICQRSAQWSTEPSGGAKIGKFKFKFLVRIWVIGCAMNLSGQDNAHLLFTKAWESARFLFDSDTGFLFFLETPESLTNPSQILLT